MKNTYLQKDSPCWDAFIDSVFYMVVFMGVTVIVSKIMPIGENAIVPAGTLGVFLVLGFLLLAFSFPAHWREDAEEGYRAEISFLFVLLGIVCSGLLVLFAEKVNYTGMTIGVAVISGIMLPLANSSPLLSDTETGRSYMIRMLIPHIALFLGILMMNRFEALMISMICLALEGAGPVMSRLISKEDRNMFENVLPAIFGCFFSSLCLLTGAFTPQLAIGFSLALLTGLLVAKEVTSYDVLQLIIGILIQGGVIFLFLMIWTR